jgi:hypothetical protein
MSRDRPPIILVLPTHPAPDDLPCNSIRDHRQFRSYKQVQRVPFASWPVKAEALMNMFQLLKE